MIPLVDGRLFQNIPCCDSLSFPVAAFNIFAPALSLAPSSAYAGEIRTAPFVRPLAKEPASMLRGCMAL